MADVEVSHLRVQDDDPLGIGFVIEFASNGQAGLCRGRADQFDDDAIADQRFGAPIWVMNENRRCSRLEQTPTKLYHACSRPFLNGGAGVRHLGSRRFSAFGYRSNAAVFEFLDRN